MTPCLHPGCATLVDRGRCPEHQRRKWRDEARARTAQGDPAMSTYGHQWQRTRRRFLKANPNCARCDQPATIADHEPPRRQLIEAGIPNPDDPAWLQPLCKPCHDRKTSTEDGGFGRPVRSLDER